MSTLVGSAGVPRRPIHSLPKAPGSAVRRRFGAAAAVRGVLAAVVAAGAGTASGTAWASGLDVPQVGSAQSGPANADPAALYHCPAQLGFLGRAELLVTAGALFADLRYRRRYLGVYQTPDSLQFQTPIDPAYIDTVKSGSTAPEVRTRPAGPIGGLFFSVPVWADRIVLGGGLYVPYAAALDFPDDGAQRFAVRDVRIAVARTALGLAARVHRRVSLGASLSYVLGYLEMSKVQDFAAVDAFHDTLADPPVNQPNAFGSDAPTAVRELDVLARPLWIQGGISHGVSFNVGIAVEPTERLDLALTYDHGSRLDARGRFVLDMDHDLFTQDLAAEGLSYPPVVRGDARVRFRLPMRVTLGAGYDAGRSVRVDGYVAYVAWRTVDAYDVTLTSPDLAQPELGVPPTVRQAIARRWKDTVAVRASVRVRPRPPWLVSATVGYDSPASPDATIDAASPDGHRLTWGLAGGYRIRGRVDLLLDTAFQHVLPRTVTTSDRDLGNGTYRMFVGQVGLAVRARFAGKDRRRARGLPSGEEPAAP